MVVRPRKTFTQPSPGTTLELEAGEYNLYMDFNHGPTRLMSLYVPEFR